MGRGRICRRILCRQNAWVRVYKFGNGLRYEGAWHEGRRQGLGMYTFRSGETQAGHWHNGILDVPSTQSATSPVSPAAVNHSKVLNSVQEARRAADKAYDVAKVNERVRRWLQLTEQQTLPELQLLKLFKSKCIPIPSMIIYQFRRYDTIH